MNIELHIERLVIDGLDIASGNGPRIMEAVESGLARLLAAKGIAPELTGGVAVPSLRAGSIRLESGATPQQLGGQIAQAVHESLHGSDRSGFR
jgi:hypothetical protein